MLFEKKNMVTRTQYHIKKLTIKYTAISIYVVGSKLQAYGTRPNGGLGIHWNLHIGEDENYKFLARSLRRQDAINEYSGHRM